MKALSIKQPWAELILQGKKRIEIRKWNTNFRGKFLIHASKSPNLKAMEEFGFNKLPLGKIIGAAELVSINRYNNETDFLKDKYEHLAGWEFGSYGFILKNIKRLKRPINAKGKLGFWEFN